jgi:hypothetical protein
MSGPRGLRLVAVALITGLMVLLGAAGAQATPAPAAQGAVVVAAANDDEGATTTDNPMGFELTDSSGISVWDMNLSTSKGSSWNPGDWDKRMWASVMDGAWASYRIVAAVEIWVLNWALTLDWMDWILTPMRGLSDLVQGFMDQLGLMPLMMIVLAVVVSFWLLRGRYAGGIVELLIGCVIAALAVGALSDPMDTIAGDNGMLVQGRDAGVEMAAAVASGQVDGQTDVDEYRNGLTTSLVDTMIRTPHQIINYGQVIDGTGCEDAYNDAVAGDDARSKIGDCNEALGDYADSPDAMKAMTVLSVLPTAYFLFIFSMLLVTLVLVTVLGAAWTAVRMIPQLVMGVVPGSSRAGLFRSLAMAVFGMFMLACSIVFVVVWMQFLQSFFGSSSGLPWIVRIYLVDVLLVVGGVVLWVFRHKAKVAFKNVADRLAKLGASSMAPPSSMPRLPRLRTPKLPSRTVPAVRPALPVSPQTAGDSVRTAASVVGAGASMSSAHGVRQLVGASGRAALPPGPSGAGGTGPRPRPALPGGPGVPAGRGAQSIGSAARVRGRIAQGASLAIQAGAAVATSGGSAAATAGARTIAAGGAKAAASAGAKSAAAKTAAGTAAKAAGAAGRSGAATAGTSTTGAAARAAARSAARSVRSDQVRARLQAVQMRPEGDRVVDEQTGRSYTVRSAPTPGMQILQPAAEQRRPRQDGAA